VQVKITSVMSGDCLLLYQISPLSQSTIKRQTQSYHAGSYKQTPMMRIMMIMMVMMWSVDRSRWTLSVAAEQSTVVVRSLKQVFFTRSTIRATTQSLQSGRLDALATSASSKKVRYTHLLYWHNFATIHHCRHIYTHRSVRLSSGIDFSARKLVTTLSFVWVESHVTAVSVY